MLNISISQFKKKHQNKKNQILFHTIKSDGMWDLCKLCQVAAKVPLDEKDHGRPISISYRKALCLECDEKVSDLVIDGHKKRLAKNPSFNKEV